MHKTQNSANTSVFEGKKMFLAGSPEKTLDSHNFCNVKKKWKAGNTNSRFLATFGNAGACTFLLPVTAPQACKLQYVLQVCVLQFSVWTNFWSCSTPKKRMLLWHTAPSRPFNRGRLCKNEGRTIQNCRKHRRTLEKTMENGAAQAEKWRSKHTWSFPIQDRCIRLANGGSH